MPCSALMLPPAASTRSCTMRFATGDCVHEPLRPTRPRARRGCSAGCRRPGARTSRTARREARCESAACASRRNCGIADTGTEMSCLMFGPSRRCASEMFSRSAHSAARCASDWPIVASSTMPSSTPLGERLLERLAQVRRCPRDRRPAPARTTRARAADRALCGWCLRDSASDNPLMSSKPTSRSARRALEQREQPHGRVDIRNGHQRRRACARRREELQHGGRDDAERSFGADEQVLEVVAGVVLAQAAQSVPDATVGQHDFQPHAQARARCRSEARPCRPHSSTDCRRSCSFLRTRATAETAFRASAAAACAWASVAPASIVIVAFATSSARTRFMRDSESTIASPAVAGVAAPHMLVLPPCGTMGTPPSAQSRTTAATCSVDAGRTTASAAPR